MLLSLDAAEIYSGGGTATGTRIHHNWLHDTQTPIPFPGNYPRSGVYLDEDSNGFEVDQNVLWNNEFFNVFLHGSTSGVTTPFDNYVHNNSVPDVASNGYVWLDGVTNCGTTAIQDNLVFVPVSQTTTNPPCMAIDNTSTAPGATEMTSSVQVGCNFIGCYSSGPPAVSGTSVGPSIASQPLSIVVTAGQTAAFSVTAGGSPTLTYQWQRNGANIPGANNATYTTSPTTFADNGAVFTVQVGNSLGSPVSSAATLTIGMTPVLIPAITAVTNAASGSAILAPNTWVAIYGLSLAPVGDLRTWQGPDFVGNQMPTQLDGVGATMNGESAYVYYISPNQADVLTPPDLAPGPVQVTVTNGGLTSASFTSQAQETSPSFFTFNGQYVAATHVNGTLIGPATLYPGATTPAMPGETVAIYASGFGATNVPVTSGSLSQSGTLSPLPVIQIGGVAASVQFAGLVAPGEFQFNVVIPASLGNGDQPITAGYGGSSTQTGALITVHN